MRLILFIACLPYFVFAQKLESNIKYLALGDSYTIGASVVEEKRWPNQFIDSLRNLGFNIEKNDIIATSGWTTSSLINAISSADLEPDYNLVSILIGVNNFYQNKPVSIYRKELSEIIDSVLVLTNQDTQALFLVTIPDYGYTPFGENSIPSISADTDLYNGIKDSTAAKYGIPVFDITAISREGLNDPELVAIDGLHPSAKQYKLWVDLILNQMIGVPSSVKPTQRDYYNAYLSNENLIFKSLAEGLLKISKITGETISQKNIELNEEYILPLNRGLYGIQFVVGDKVFSEVIIQP